MRIQLEIGEAIAVFAGLMVASTAFGQVTFGGCRDFGGRPVASVVNYQMNDVAAANVVNGMPVIYYNPAVLAWLQPQTRLFFYGHECGHHALGHTLGSNPLTREQEADCWGIRKLASDGLLDDGDIGIVQRDLAGAGPGDWTHLPGPVRAINLRRCLSGQDRTSETDSCRSARDGACDEPEPCRPGTDSTDCRGQRRRRVQDECRYANDGECDEPDTCAPGTDGTDCVRRGRREVPRSRADRCPHANDGTCDEPSRCPLGSDSVDCRGRTTNYWVRNLYCCDAFGRRWCPIVVDPGPVGSPCGCAGAPGVGMTCQ